jgi:hypothetical protein
LKFRPELCATCGMLFVYPTEERRSFYTQDVFIPLDIAYFSADRRLIEVRTLPPDAGRDFDPGAESGAADSSNAAAPETFPSSEPFRYALAVRGGWFAARDLGRYTKLALPRDLPAL